jgi:hypothetical protein
MGVWGAAVQGVLGVDSAYTAGNEAVKQAELNSKRALSAAADARIRGAQEAGAAVMAGSQLQKKQMVAFSNSGVDATVGTAANVQAATAAAAKLEALTIENNAAREAWGYKKHGMDYATEAGLASSRRDREMAGAAGTTLGALASGYSKWKKDRE